MNDFNPDYFEHVILKNLMTNQKYFTKCFGILKAKYFENHACAELFKIVKKYYEDYHESPSIIEVATKIKDTANSDLRKTLADGIRSVNSTESEYKNFDFLCQETVTFVKDAMYLEALSVGAEGLEKRSDTLKQKAQRIIDEMVKINIDNNPCLDFDDIDDMILYFKEKNIGIRTQHRELNKRLGSGFLPGTLSLIMAAQSVGKSLLMCDLASGMLKNNKNVLLVSLEMSDREMMKRIYANVLDVDVQDFSAMPDDPEIETKVRDAYNNAKLSGTLGKFFVKDFPACSFSSLQLEALIQRMKQENDIEFDCVFVDYLGIMKSDLISPNAGLYSYIKSIGEELRAVAKKLGIAVISASQLNRSSINKTDDVDNSAIADSLGSAMTADFILMLLQNEDMKEKAEIVCKVTKNRFTGITDTWMMGIDYPKMTFVDLVSEFNTIAQKDDATKLVKTEVKNLETGVAKAKSDDFDSFMKDLGI